jgi:hypothetical protein
MTPSQLKPAENKKLGFHKNRLSKKIPLIALKADTDAHT